MSGSSICHPAYISRKVNFMSSAMHTKYTTEPSLLNLNSICLTGPLFQSYSRWGRYNKRTMRDRTISPNWAAMHVPSLTDDGTSNYTRRFNNAYRVFSVKAQNVPVKDSARSRSAILRW